MEMVMVYPSWFNNKNVLWSSDYHHHHLIHGNGRRTKSSLFDLSPKRRKQLICHSHPSQLLLLSSSSSIQHLQQIGPITAGSYGALLLAGALFAYTRSGSKGSLFGGLVGSSSMAAAYILMQAPETREIGDSLAFGSALLFTFIFGIRLAATRKVIPAGLLFGISIAASAVFLSAYLQDGQSLM